MSDLREAAKLALIALENGTSPNLWLSTKENLRQALAQPEQEPVVGMFEEKLPDQNPPPWSRSYRLKRDWVGLTQEEVDALLWKLSVGAVDEDVRTIEAKLKEKNT